MTESYDMIKDIEKDMSVRPIDPNLQKCIRMVTEKFKFKPPNAIERYDMMKDIEKDMFGDCPKDDDNKYLMPLDYKECVHIETQLGKMGDDAIKKLVQDFGIFRAIKSYWIYHSEYPPFDDDKDDKDMDCMVIQRILAFFIIERWIFIDRLISYNVIDRLIADMDKNDAKNMMDKLIKKMME